MFNLKILLSGIKDNISEKYFANKKYFIIAIMIFLLGIIFGFLAKSSFSSFIRLDISSIYETSALTKFLTHRISRESFLLYVLFFYVLYFLIAFFCNICIYTTPFLYLFFFIISIKLGCDLTIIYSYLGIVSLPFIIIFIFPMNTFCYICVYIYGILCFKTIFESHYYGCNQTLIHYVTDLFKFTAILMFMVLIFSLVMVYSTIVIV